MVSICAKGLKMKRYRLALLMAIGAYPAVLLALMALPASFATTPLMLKPLFILPAIVLWMVYVVSPLIHAISVVGSGCGTDGRQARNSASIRRASSASPQGGLTTNMPDPTMP